MKKIKDLDQPKENGGEQKVLLDRAITAETDELDPKFKAKERPTPENKNTPKPLEE